MKTGLCAVALLATIVSAHAEQMMTEQQARVAAAQFGQGPMFGCVDQHNAAECIANLNLPRVTAARTVEILSHIRESLLVVRGDTHYCGVIRSPTWILMWDNDEATKEWFGGYPVMIDARTGKVPDCRS